MQPTAVHRKDPEWDNDMMFAFETAAELIDNEEFGGENADRQMAAYREVAKQIRTLGRRYERRVTTKLARQRNRP